MLEEQEKSWFWVVENFLHKRVSIEMMRNLSVPAMPTNAMVLGRIVGHFPCQSWS